MAYRIDPRCLPIAWWFFTRTWGHEPSQILLLTGGDVHLLYLVVPHSSTIQQGRGNGCCVEVTITLVVAFIPGRSDEPASPTANRVIVGLIAKCFDCYSQLNHYETLVLTTSCS